MLFVPLFLCIMGMQLDISEGSRIFFPGDSSFMNMLESSFIPATRNSISNRAGNECRLPQGETGMCVPFNDCPELMNDVELNGVRSSLGLLRSRICRFLTQSVHLCCVVESLPVVTSSPVSPVSVGTINDDGILPTMGQCGFATADRIVDGVEITPGSQPWLVGIGSLINEHFDLKCGGTLITRRHVLSAAHCFHRTPGARPSSLTHILLGEHSLSQNLPGEQPTVVKIASRKDPGYDPESFVNDLELITMERDVAFTNVIRPACLPFKFRSMNFNGEDLLVSGWGDTFHGRNLANDVPLSVTISVTAKEECRVAHRNSPELLLDSTQFCAGGGTAKDACQGDSGGPAIYRDFNDTRLDFIVGVTSVGVKCGNPKFPGIYTFVPELLTWIQNNLS